MMSYGCLYTVYYAVDFVLYGVFVKPLRQFESVWLVPWAGLPC